MISKKTIEKLLFAAYRPQLPNGRRTRSYLRKMARHIQHGYEIGRRDRAAGKPLIPLDAVRGADDSPLKREMTGWAYRAYCAGYRAGAAGGKEG